MSEDLIKRSDAISACAYETFECYEARKAIRNLPSADRPPMTTHDFAVALAKRLEEEGITDEELERIIHDAKEEARKEIAKMKGANNEM